MMKKIWILFLQMLKQISRDFMLILLCITPVLAGIFFRFVIPVIESYLCQYFHQSQIIAPYYYVCDWLLSLLPGMMFAFVGGLVVLGELDDKIAGYMALTPVGSKGYLFSRLGFPTLLSVAVSVVVVCAFGLSHMNIFSLLILCISSSMLGLLTALLVVAISTNKVEGIAIGKLSGFVSLGLFVPIVFHTNLQYLAGILPSFWIGKFLLEGNGFNLVGFAIIYIVWMYWLLKRYEGKIVL